MVYKPQLYFDSYRRARLLAQHDFFVEQAEKRILKQYENISEEAEKRADEEYQRIGRLGHIDESEAAERANDYAEEYYALLSDMKVQMHLAALAALYHQWDKNLRNFLEMEISHDFSEEMVRQYCWESNIRKLCEVLEAYGINFQKMTFYNYIDAARLIVNVYKHGKGNSFDEICQKYPEYIKSPLPILGSHYYGRIAISDYEFKNMADAFREFWQNFPERSYLKV